MRRLPPRLLGLLLAGLLAGPLAAAPLDPSSPLGRRLQQPISANIDEKLFDEAVLIYSNAARQANGRPPLTHDPKLFQVAVDQARNMARLKIPSHELPIPGQSGLKQRLDRQALDYRNGAENIAMGKVYRLLGRPISAHIEGCRFTYSDTRQPVPVHSYASLAEEVVSRWMASPRHRASLLSPTFNRLGSGVGIDPNGPSCGDVYLVQDFAD